MRLSIKYSFLLSASIISCSFLLSYNTKCKAVDAYNVDIIRQNSNGATNGIKTAWEAALNARAILLPALAVGPPENDADAVARYVASLTPTQASMQLALDKVPDCFVRALYDSLSDAMRLLKKCNSILNGYKTQVGFPYMDVFYDVILGASCITCVVIILNKIDFLFLLDRMRKLHKLHFKASTFGNIKESDVAFLCASVFNQDFSSLIHAGAAGASLLLAIYLAVQFSQNAATFTPMALQGSIPKATCA
jgi:hypothetical protein